MKKKVKIIVSIDYIRLRLVQCPAVDWLLKVHILAYIIIIEMFTKPLTSWGVDCGKWRYTGGHLWLDPINIIWMFRITHEWSHETQSAFLMMDAYMPWGNSHLKLYSCFFFAAHELNWRYGSIIHSITGLNWVLISMNNMEILFWMFTTPFFYRRSEYLQGWV